MNTMNVLVEATLDEISVDAYERVVRLELSSSWERGKRYRFVATGVDELLVDSMRLTNIVDHINLLDSENVHEHAELAGKLFFMMRGREAEKAELEWDALTAKILRIQCGELAFLEIEAVYGASLMLLAHRIELIAV